PHPRRQRRRHIDHILARRDKLLGKEITEATRRLDRPRPFTEWLRPTQQPLQLPSTSPHRKLADLTLVLVDRERRVLRLMRIDTNDHHHRESFHQSDEEPRRHS